MTLEDAEAVLDCMDAEGFEGRLYPDYSGRFMYGKTTTGVVGELDELLLAAGAAVNKIIDKSGLGIDIQPVFHGVGISIEVKSHGFPHEKCVRTPNRGGACGTYTVPYFKCPDHANDHILIGASNQ